MQTYLNLKAVDRIVIQQQIFEVDASALKFISQIILNKWNANIPNFKTVDQIVMQQQVSKVEDSAHINQMTF